MSIDRDFLKQCVVDATSDDYENFELLSREIASWAKQDNQEYSDKGLVDAIEAMVLQKLIRVYKFDILESRFVESEFSVADLPNLWFYAKPVSGA